MKPFVSVLLQCLEQTERAVCQPMFGFIDKGGFGEKKVTQYCWLFSPTQMIYWPVRAAVKDKDTREWQHNGKRGGKKERERESD